MVRGLETVEKKSTSSGANKPMGKNDIYLQILKGYVLKENGVNLFHCKHNFGLMSRKWWKSVQQNM